MILELGKDLLVLGEARGALLKPIGVHHAAREFEEGLREDALAAVHVDDALIELDAIQHGGGPRRDALGERLLLDAVAPGAEIAAAVLGKGRPGQRPQVEKDEHLQGMS